MAKIAIMADKSVKIDANQLPCFVYTEQLNRLIRSNSNFSTNEIMVLSLI